MDLAGDFGKMALGKLDGDNYHSWKFNIRMYLMGKDIWDVVDGTDSLAADADATEKLRFKKLDQKAMAAICLNVKPALQIYVRNAKSAKEAWDCLSNHFEKNTLAKKIEKRKELYTCRLKPGISMESHLNHLKTIAEHMEALNDPVSDLDLVMILLSGLPDSYNNFITAIESLKEEELVWTYIRDRLLAEYERKKGSGGKGASRTEDDALLANNNFGGKKNFHKTKKGGIECHHCHQKGHIRRDCPKWKAKNASDPTKNAEEASKFTTSGNVGVKTGLDPDFGNAFAFMNVESGNSVGDDDWWIDSGATQHMTYAEEDFITLSMFEDPLKVNLADDSHLFAYGSGVVGVHLYDVNNKKVNCVLKNTLFIPEIQNKLFSVSSAVREEGVVKFDKSEVTWENNGAKMLIGKKYGKLYKLNGQSQSKDSCYFSKNRENSVSLWHQRFGHLNENDLKSLFKNQLVSGLNLAAGKGDEVCHGCELGKSKRFPFPKTSQRKTTKPLQLIHSDLCGPLNIASVGGSKYFVSFIDDYSRYVSVYFLKTKDEAYDKFIEYVELVENQFDLKVKKFRSDGGGEYISTNFKNFCKSRGIAVEGSISYSPQQNGVAERMNRTLMEMARSMISHSNAPSNLWAEAVATAAHIRNRCPTSSFKGATPCEMLSGVKPDVNHLRVFGCDVYVHIPDQKRRKLDKKAYKAVFVGYPLGKKGYKIYNPANKRFAYSRDVTFIENSFTMFDTTTRNLAGQEFSTNFDTTTFDTFDNFDSFDTFFNTFDTESNHEEDFQVEDPTHDEIDDVDDVIIDVLEEDQVTINGKVVGKLKENDIAPTRRSSRVSKEPDYFGERANIMTESSGDPKTYKQAMKSKQSENWKIAAKEEYSSLQKHNTWELVDLPNGANLVGCKWVFKTKRKADGTVDRFKARLVAQGYSQEEGIDFDEVFAPVAKYKSIRTVLAIANQLDLDIHQMDVKSAFLNGELHEDIYMKQPEGFVDEINPSKVCRLKKSLYGLKQSARCWNQVIDKYLKSSGYIQSDADACIYYKHKTINGKKIIVIIAVYVDDTIICSNDTATLKSEKKNLSDQFEMDDRGELHYILGMAVKRDRKKRVLTIDQNIYLQDVLKRFGMEDCKPVATPVEPGKKFTVLKDEKEAFPNVQMYQAAIGSLNYAAIATRPDLSVAVGMLSQHMRNPSHEHWSGVKRVLRYIRGSIDFGLRFTYSDEFVLSGFADADWAGCVDTRKSTSGEFFKLGNNPISWRSKKQSIVALSSCEAEYVSLCSATQEVVWLRRLLNSVGFTQNNPTIMYEDNQGAICLSKKSKDHSRTKHVDVKYHYTREVIEKNLITLEYCPTGNMIADTLTKGLPKPAFEKFRAEMGVHRC